MEHKQKHQARLAWHETLMLHEIVMSSATNLMQFKKMLPDVEDPELRKLYEEAIDGTEANLKELIPFYSYGPDPVRSASAGGMDESPFQSGALLGSIKSAVQSYASTILETATKELHKTLVKQMNTLIDLHYKVWCYMYEKGYYPSYDLEQLRQNDVMMAEKALKN